MATNRIDRISEEYMRILADAIRTLKDPRVTEAMVSVTHCEVTGDLRYVKVFISVLGTDEQTQDVMRGLKSASGFLRREVARKMQLRYAPEIVLETDHSIEQGAHINAILHKLGED